MAGSAKTFYITTPIYYVNDAPHIGHAYTTLACDVLARFKRLDGYKVKFLTGTDEHGQKVEKSAMMRGVAPQVFTDQVSQNFRELAVTMGYSNNDFIRTTQPRHKTACQALWKRLIERNEIYLDAYKGWYAVRDEAFYGENELGTGPGGERLAPTGAPVEWVEEPSYFFRLSKWQDRLLAFYEENPNFIAPESRRNEVMGFVKGGLNDLSVSRTTFSWGVPVPGPAPGPAPGDDAHIMYVWLDALTNYLTACGYPDLSAAEYQAFWPADLHMVGKDILRFHAVYWPAFLMAADLPLPRRIFAHGWWTNEGQKISKSLANVIDPFDLVERYGIDQTRFFLLREVPFGQDGDFSHHAMVTRMNSELANDLGNLVQRVLSMIEKNCAAAIPDAGPLSGDDQDLLARARGLLEAVRAHLDRQAFHEALEAVWGVVRAANVHVDRQAPWVLRKTDPDRMKTVLWVLAETIRHVALVLLPVMPTSAAKILDQLAIPHDRRTFAAWGEGGELKKGTPLPTPHGIFPRFVDDESTSGQIRPGQAMKKGV